LKSRLTETKLLLATTNQGKTQEISQFLKGLPVHVFSLLDLRVRSYFEEKGLTFLDNARGKSLFYSRTWTDLILGEDSGLEIDCLNGAPGIISARYSGPEATDETNIQKVLHLMEDVPPESREAKFVSCMVLSRQRKILIQIQEEVRGFITTEKKGRHGFGYDPIFYYPPLKRTFAELLPEEKNRISHRGRALKRLKDYLKEHLNHLQE
jgi:XTP/dITP diphosphohydrolase